MSRIVPMTTIFRDKYEQDCHGLVKADWTTEFTT